MSNYPVHTIETAPEGSKATLENAQRTYGFIPNLYGVMANSPAVVEAYTQLATLFGKTTFNATEQQIILLATSQINGCTYCMAAHSVVAQMSKVPADIVEALRQGAPLADAKLEALRQVTVAVVESRGWPSEQVVGAFLDAGYNHQQLLEVILGVTMKTLSNYTNHTTATPLDAAFQPAEWKKAS